MPDAITDQPECASCGGACCQPERLEFPVPEGTKSETLAQALADLGLPDGLPFGLRVNKHGRTVIATCCRRRFRDGGCPVETRPDACLRFPLNYLDANHSAAERAEVAEFCALFRRLQVEVQT